MFGRLLWDMYYQYFCFGNFFFLSELRPELCKLSIVVQLHTVCHMYKRDGRCLIGNLIGAQVMADLAADGHDVALVEVQVHAKA